MVYEIEVNCSQLVTAVDGVDVEETQQAVVMASELRQRLDTLENRCAVSGDESSEYMQLVEPEKIAALTKAFDAFCRQNV